MVKKSQVLGTHSDPGKQLGDLVQNQGNLEMGSFEALEIILPG